MDVDDERRITIEADIRQAVNALIRAELATMAAALELDCADALVRQDIDRLGHLTVVNDLTFHADRRFKFVASSWPAPIISDGDPRLAMLLARRLELDTRTLGDDA